MIHLFQGSAEEMEELTREEMDLNLMRIINREEQRVSRAEERLAYIFHKTEIEEKGLTSFENYTQMDLEEIIIPLQKEILGIRLSLNIYETELKHYAKRYQIQEADPELLEDYENVRRHIQLIRILYLEDLEPSVHDAFLARLGSLNEEICRENRAKDSFSGVEELLEKYFGIYSPKNGGENFGMRLLEEFFQDVALITGNSVPCDAILKALKKGVH